MDGVLAFECEYLKNRNASTIEFSIPIKHNSTSMDTGSKIVDSGNDFGKDAIAQRDILLTYLANRLLIDKITWKLQPSDVKTTLDRNNYPNPKFIPMPIIVSGTYNIETVVTSNKQSIKIKLTKK